MYISRKIVVIAWVIVLIVIFSIPLTISAQAEQNTNSSPEIMILTTRTQAIVGEILAWLLRNLESHCGKIVSNEHRRYRSG